MPSSQHRVALAHTHTHTFAHTSIAVHLPSFCLCHIEWRTRSDVPEDAAPASDAIVANGVVLSTRTCVVDV